MQDLLALYGIYPKGYSNKYHCPFHDDQKPSANIRKAKNNFHCFPCGIDLDIFDFVAKMENFNGNEKDIRWQSVKFINEKFNLGLVGNLSYKQKLEMRKRDRERQKAKKEKQLWAEFERQTCIKIADQLKLWEQIATDCHLTRGEYRSENWELADLYFHALKQHDLLSFLYDTLNGHENYNSNYTYFIGTDRPSLLKRIAKGEIEI